MTNSIGDKDGLSDGKLVCSMIEPLMTKNISTPLAPTVVNQSGVEWETLRLLERMV